MDISISILVFLFATNIVCVSTEQNIKFSILEESPSFTYVGNIAIEAELEKKLDSDLLANVNFRILTQESTAAQYFMVEKNGALRTSDVIDREILCPQQFDCLLKFGVAVHSPPTFFERITVIVEVEDMNDNSPMFSTRDLVKSIPENMPTGSSFSIPVADDLDSPKFGIQSYRIISGTPEFALKVQNNSGGSLQPYLVLKEKLDREKRELYRIVVAALDGGHTPRSQAMTINIGVQDVNDNPPQFVNSTYSANVTENTKIGTVLLRVTANDPDVGLNGELVYNMSRKNNDAFGHVFAVNNSTGDISLLDNLDYEKRNRYNLIIIARDKTMESFSAETMVDIRVIDVNDHAPRVTVDSLTSSGHLQIPESANSGHFVGYVAVDDPDTGLGGEFHCTLTDDHFEIEALGDTDGGRYKLMTSSSLDYEQSQYHNILFVCEDKGTPRLTSTSTVKVTVLDENDNDPVFSQSEYIATVDENQMAGAFVIQLTATDPDSGSRGWVRYSLNNPEAEKYIRIDPMSGNVTTTVSFDYERIHELSVVILASDRGIESRTTNATLHILIQDQNDEAPKFSLSRYTFTVPENEQVGTEVGQVDAVDRDSKQFNKHQFALKSTSANFFAIDRSSGKIFTTVVLDRENRSDYNLVVVATDLGQENLTSSVNLSIIVTDKNDNSPVIQFPVAENSSISVSNLAPAGHRLHPPITATDDDIGRNANLTYYIRTGNENGFFAVNKMTGELIITGDLNGFREKTFRMIIYVKDSGVPQRITESILHVVVNKSISFDQVQCGSLICGQNLVIVVSVVVVSAALILILIVAIVIVKRQDNKQRRINNMAKLLAHQSFEVNQANIRAKSDREIDPAEKEKKEVSFSQEVEISDEFSSWDQKSCPTLDDDGSLQLNNTPHSQSLALDPKRHLLYRQDNILSNRGQFESTATSALQVDTGDQDSESGVSSATSNGDSGRGSHEDGSSWPSSMDTETTEPVSGHASFYRDYQPSQQERNMLPKRTYELQESQCHRTTPCKVKYIDQISTNQSPSRAPHHASVSGGYNNRIAPGTPPSYPGMQRSDNRTNINSSYKDSILYHKRKASHV